MWEAFVNLLQGRKCVILENLSTTTRIESCPLTVLGRPKMKSMKEQELIFRTPKTNEYNLTYNTHS